MISLKTYINEVGQVNDDGFDSLMQLVPDIVYQENNGQPSTIKLPAMWCNPGKGRSQTHCVGQL